MKFALALSSIAGALFGFGLTAGFVWTIGYFLIGLNITYLQVLGVVILIDFLKNYLE